MVKQPRLQEGDALLLAASLLHQCSLIKFIDAKIPFLSWHTTISRWSKGSLHFGDTAMLCCLGKPSILDSPWEVHSLQPTEHRCLKGKWSSKPCDSGCWLLGGSASRWEEKIMYVCIYIYMYTYACSMIKIVLFLYSSIYIYRCWVISWYVYNYIYIYSFMCITCCRLSSSRLGCIDGIKLFCHIFFLPPSVFEH